MAASDVTKVEIFLVDAGNASPAVLVLTTAGKGDAVVFGRADASGNADVSDASFGLNYLFPGGPAPGIDNSSHLVCESYSACS